MATVLETLKVILDGDSSGLERSFFRSAKALQKVEASLAKFDQALASTARQETKTTSETEKLLRAIERTNNSAKDASGWAKSIAIFQRYRAALILAKNALESIFTVMESSARTDTARKFFEDAGNSLADFRTATRGLVSDADLVKKANLAQTMGINADQFKALAKVAQASAAKTGQSFAHMLDSIILGSARESRLLLDNLGIIIDVTKAREDYVQKLRESNSLGEMASKTNKQLAASLTDEAEKAAFLAAAMEAGAPVLEQYEKLGGGAAENFDKFHAAMQNLKDAIGSAFLTVLDGAINKLTEFVETIASLSDKDLMILIGTLGFAGVAPGFWKQATTKDSGISPEERQNMMRVELQKRGVTINEMTGRLDQALDLTADQLKKFGYSQAEILAYQHKRLTEWNADTFALIQQFRELNKQTKLFKVPGAADKSPFKPKETTESERKAYENWLRSWNKKMEKVGKDIDNLWMEAGVADPFKDTFDKFKKEADAGWYEYGEMRKKAMQAESDAYRQMLDDIDAYQKIQSEKNAEAINKGGAVATSLLQGDVKGLGSAIGALFGPEGATLGSLIGEFLSTLRPVVNLFEMLSKGIVRLLQLALDPLFYALEPLGPALYILLEAIGLLINSALQPWIPAIELIVTALVVVIDAFAGLIAVLGPLIEVASALLGVFVTLAGFLVEMAASQGPFGSLSNFADVFTKTMIDLIVYINNGIVGAVRDMGRLLRKAIGDDLGLESFGTMLLASQLYPPEADAAITDNTDATKDNTAAVRDLSRELRNLPQGYKINYRFYESTQAMQRVPFNLGSDYSHNLRGVRNSNFRWRT